MSELDANPATAPAATADKSPNDFYYEKTIAPKLLSVANLCKKRDLPFLALVEVSPTKTGRTEVATVTTSVRMAITALANQCGGNIDQFVLSVAQLVRDNGLAHQSAVLTTLGLDPDPAKRNGEPAPRDVVEHAKGDGEPWPDLWWDVEDSENAYDAPEDWARAADLWPGDIARVNFMTSFHGPKKWCVIEAHGLPDSDDVDYRVHFLASQEEADEKWTELTVAAVDGADNGADDE